MSQFAGLPWWGWVLILVGVLALIMVLSALFLPDWNRPDYIQMAEVPVESDDFVRHVATALNVPILHGDRATILQNGDAFYGAMLEAIRSAKESVHFQVYIFEGDTIGTTFLEAFKERAQAGIEVRVLLDAFGSIRLPRAERAALRSAGAKLEFFRPLRIWNLVRVFKRDHRRAIVIDGRTAFIGGAAVADKWCGKARGPNEWRDNLTCIAGELAAGVQAAFANSWLYCAGEVLAGPRYFPAPAGLQGDIGGTDEPAGMVVISSPADANQPIRLLFWLSIVNARHSIYLSNSYFIPDRQIREAIVERARAGVDVRILVPGPATDAKPVRRAGHSYYEALLEAGVRVFEFQPSMMHAKSVVVDGIWTIVGSANMDERSMELNEEANMAVRDRALAGAVTEGFLADLERSREIALDEWRRRSPLTRLVERAAMLLIEQY